MADTDTDQTPSTRRLEMPPLPAEAVPIVALRNVVLFPGIVLPVTLGREESIAAAQDAVRSGRKVGLLLQRDPTLEKPAPTDLYEIGVLATVVRYVTAPDGAHHMVCQGESRFRLQQVVRETPFLAARIETIAEPEVAGADIEARTDFLKQRAAEALSLLPQVPAELTRTITGIDSPGQLADLIVSFMDVKPEEKQDVLETVDLKARLDKVMKLLAHRVEVLKITRDITEQTQAALGERQREAVLREQLHQLQKELGEGEGAGGDIAELEKAIAAAHMPAEVDEQARKELRRLERMSEASPEYGMVRGYLELLVALPWSHADVEDIDIERARRVLDEDHYGLEKVKRRILEYLAVRKLNPEGRSPILCFVGPPGVGKTSLGQSVARALGVSFQGDPASALLEVLDPEQNSSFRDNYLGLPFDLSHVLFIATANVLETIPGPLRDRMEIIELTGYTEDEKLEIAKRYLVARQLKANGLKPEQVSLADAALSRLIREYTRESGCRSLERQIGALLRRAAMRIAEGKVESVRFEADDVAEVLGPTRFENEVAQRTCVPGVATGLAWTPVGGDILFVESARMPGSGKLILTGQLGDVMKESAQAALSLV